MIQICHLDNANIVTDKNVLRLLVENNNLPSCQCYLYLFSCLYPLMVQACYPGHTTLPIWSDCLGQ